MNLEHLKKSVGHLVKLHPIAVRLDKHGNELETLDDDWAIREVTSSSVRIENTATGHFKVLGTDHVHHYTTNPTHTQSGVTRGFLTLTVQLFLQGRDVVLRPTARPGERTTLDGRTPQERAARARLLYQRLQMVMEDYETRGTPEVMLAAFDDLSRDEKANLYERAVKLRKGRVPARNPFRE